MLPLTISFSLSSFPTFLSSVFLIFYDFLLDIQYWLLMSLKACGRSPLRYVTIFPAGRTSKHCAHSDFRLCNKLKHWLPREMNLTHAKYGTGSYINSSQHARLTGSHRGPNKPAVFWDMKPYTKCRNSSLPPSSWQSEWFWTSLKMVEASYQNRGYSHSSRHGVKPHKAGIFMQAWTWHSGDRTSWNILITKPTRCTNFSNLFLE